MHIGGTCTNSPWNIYALLRLHEIGVLTKSLIMDLISVPIPLPQGPENTNLYSPQWVLSIQPGVLAFPLAYGYQTVSRKSSPDLWKRVNFKTFRRYGPWNKKRNTDAWYNTSQKTTGERAWRLSLYCISLAPTGYPTRAMFLAFSAAAPHVAQIFWLLLIIWGKNIVW